MSISGYRPKTKTHRKKIRNTEVETELISLIMIRALKIRNFYYLRS